MLAAGCLTGVWKQFPSVKPDQTLDGRGALWGVRKATREDKGIPLCSTETKECEESREGVVSRKKGGEKAKSEQKEGVQPEDLHPSFLNHVFALP